MQCDRMFPVVAEFHSICSCWWRCEFPFLLVSFSGTRSASEGFFHSLVQANSDAHTAPRYISYSLEGLVEGIEDLQGSWQRYLYDHKKWKNAEMYKVCSHMCVCVCAHAHAVCVCTHTHITIITIFAVCI